MKSFRQVIRVSILLAAGAAVSAYPQVRPDILSDISVNSVGFLPGLSKKASVKITGGQTGVASPDSFTVVRVSDNGVAFRGRLGNNINNTDTRDTVRVADFSALTEPGRYYVASRGKTSPEFDIADDAFNETYRAMMLGFYLWRCGNPGGVEAEYNGETYKHATCHTNPGNLQYYGGSGTKDGTGGWHDAGDFTKYTTNAAHATGLLLKAWEHNGESLGKIGLLKDVKVGNIPAFLSEVKWNIDWMAKMQFEDGKVSEKLSTLAHAAHVKPEDDKGTQYFVSWSTTATAGLVAVLALASRIYKPYDAELAAKWLDQAKLGYAALEANASNVPPSQSAFSTGSYAVNDSTHRLWAAAEMWETTGESKYLAYYDGRRIANIWNHISWNNANVLSAVTYLSSDKPGRRQSRVDSLRNNFITYANTLAGNTASHGYARAFGTESGSYYWGNHGALTAKSIILNTAYRFSTSEAEKTQYRNAGHEILGHILGRNYFGRSFVTGIGHKPPLQPHCRNSMVDEKPWSGYMVGGPHNQSMTDQTGPVAPQGASCVSAAACYFDVFSDYARNEIAINWSASFVYALSAFVDGSGATNIPNRQSVSAKPAAAPKIKTSRIVRTNGGKLDIPYGAKVYSLDGKLIAERKANAPMPLIRRNGVFIMRVDGK